MNERFDILVVGAGPAGIAAAVTAAERGLRVGLVDDNPAAGGQIWRNGGHLPETARKWIARLGSPSLMRLLGWRVFDAPEPGAVRAEHTESGHAATFRFAKLILATGARERFLPFPGWTLPNVMGAGGMDAMVRGGLPVQGKRVVVAGTGPLLLAVAAHLSQSGARVVAVCDQAAKMQMLPLATQLAAQPAKLLQGIRYRWRSRQSRYFTSCRVVSAQGDGRLRSVVLQRGRKKWMIECDYLACGFHLMPNTELAQLLGCRLHDGFVATDDMLRTSVENVWCAGEPTGIGGVELSLLEGRLAALAASGRLEDAGALNAERRRGMGFVHALRRACTLTPELRLAVTDETIVCRCEDVRAGALRDRSGWRDAKLHTRCGMGPCQGRICGGAVEFLFGWRADSVRPPLFPASVSSVAGQDATAQKLSDSVKETL